MPMIIGIDFDNTIVSYDELMYSIAANWGLPLAGVSKTKKQIRDSIRGLTDGEIVWQRLQAAAYGTGMGQAMPAEGVEAFFKACKDRCVPVRIVSHKTVYSNLGEEKVDLREAAMAWLIDRGFVSNNGFGIARSDVFFEATRSEKIARIRQLGITHFIDDLEETFLEPEFPDDVAKILYAPGKFAESPAMLSAFSSWAQIKAHLAPSLDRAYQYQQTGP